MTFYCPGCKCSHGIWTEGPYRWEWNGSLEKPTLNPSVLVQSTDFTAKGRADYEAWCAAGHPRTESEGPAFESMPTRCHSFVRDGQIQFLADCTHELAGSTVPLQPF